jgi:hypothetical protein
MITNLGQFELGPKIFLAARPPSFSVNRFKSSVVVNVLPRIG